jgi:hypothetical protein
MIQAAPNKPSRRYAAAVIVWMIASACGVTQKVEEAVPDEKTKYRPFGASYRGVTHARIEQTFNNQSDITEVGMQYFLTADVIPSDSVLHAALTIDSITNVVASQGAANSAQADSARGVTYTGTLFQSGRLSGLNGGDGGGSLAEELSSRLLTRFFPVIPDDGVEPGVIWTDTLETYATLGGVENTVHAIRRHEAAEWADYGDHPALVIYTTSDYTFSGAGVQVGQAFTLEGHGRRYSHQYLATDGRFLGFVSADTAEAEAYLTEAGIMIPVHQTRADTLTISQ